MADHDHAHCVARALARAEEVAATTGARLTPVRRRALEILAESHTALGAYDLLERLAAEGFGAQPPVAYRALEFLTSHGLAHRIERLNAFVACAHPVDAADHDPAFMICRECRAVAETAQPRGADALGRAAAAAGFAIEERVVEAMGLCPACRDEGAAET